MIRRKSVREIELMRHAGRIAAAARIEAGKMVRAGVTTQSINNHVHRFIKARDAEPIFLGYRGFPGSICISINEQIIHGVPSGRRLLDGDIISIDIGVKKDGYIGDCAATFIVGQGSEQARRLVEVTRQSFFEGLQYARAGNRVSDISQAVQSYAETRGYSVVREFVGHGVGSKLHESPEIPNYVENPKRKPDARLLAGMTIAIEPMINAGVAAIKVLEDKWTVVTADGKPSAHYENTILITDGDPEILTTCDGDNL